MSKNDKRTGIWIPIELIVDSNLDWTDKALYAEIMNLSKLEGGCHASNQHFGNLLGIMASAASKRISRLEKMEYLLTNKLYDKNRCIGRIIQLTVPKPTLLYMTSQKNDPNTYCSKEPGSQKNQGMVPVGKNGSSETEEVIVPEASKGGSQRNTNNTYNNSKGIIPELIPDTGESPVDVTFNQNSNIYEPDSPKILIKEGDRDIIGGIFKDIPDWEQELYACSNEQSFLAKHKEYLQQKAKEWAEDPDYQQVDENNTMEDWYEFFNEFIIAYSQSNPNS